jgi:hypothetical protein
MSSAGERDILDGKQDLSSRSRKRRGGGGGGGGGRRRRRREREIFSKGFMKAIYSKAGVD